MTASTNWPSRARASTSSVSGVKGNAWHFEETVGLSDCRKVQHQPRSAKGLGLTLPAIHAAVEELGGLFVIGKDVRVGIPGDLDAGVPQPLRHSLDVHPGLERERRVGVAQVMEADAWQVGLDAEPPELVGDVVGWTAEPSCMG
jgi:hypothetical protein